MAEKKQKKAPKESTDSSIDREDILCFILCILFGILAKTPLIGGLSVGGWLDEWSGFGIFARSLNVLFIIFGMITLAELTRFIVKRIHPVSNRKKTLLELLFSAANYIYIILGLILVLLALGVHVAGIATTVGLLGIIVGFGAESLIADVFTGVCMIFENQFNVGDIIEVNGFRGEVIQIGVRTSSIRDRGGNIKIMNNSNIKDVLNCSNKDSAAVCDIAVSYSTDIAAAERIIAQVIESMKAVPDNAFTDITYAGVNELAASGVVLRVVAIASELNVYSCKRQLNRALLLAFRENGIEIPFPQIVVHKA